MVQIKLFSTFPFFLNLFLCVRLIFGAFGAFRCIQSLSSYKPGTNVSWTVHFGAFGAYKQMHLNAPNAPKRTKRTEMHRPRDISTRFVRREALNAPKCTKRTEMHQTHRNAPFLRTWTSSTAGMKRPER